MKRHDVELVKTAITRLGADVNYLPSQDSSSLLRLVRKAAEEGGGLKRKWPPLLEAIGHNYADLVEILLSLGADGRGIDAKGNSAIHVGSAEGRGAIVRRLLEERGVEVEGANEFGQTALHLAAGRRHGGQKELVRELLLAGGEGGGKQCGGGLSPLHEACKSDNVEAALLILVAGGNIEQKDENGATPLYYAVAYGSLQCYDLLISHGAKVNVRTNEGDTLLHARFISILLYCHCISTQSLVVFVFVFVFCF